MKANSSYIALTLAIGLTGFSLGLIGARPANGQVQVAGMLGFPRISDLWNAQMSSSTFGSRPKFGGDVVQGCTFTVQRDVLNRLPVVTTIAYGGSDVSNGPLELWQADADGKYRLIYQWQGAFFATNSGVSSSITHDLGFGFVLPAGDYLLHGPSSQYGPPFSFDQKIALTGYWARP